MRSLKLRRLRSPRGRDERVVIGADTTLDLDGQLYDKPKDVDGRVTREHLLTLRGPGKHKLHSQPCVDRSQAGSADLGDMCPTVDLGPMRRL